MLPPPPGPESWRCPCCRLAPTSVTRDLHVDPYQTVIRAGKREHPGQLEELLSLRRPEHRAVEEFLARETMHVDAYMEHLRTDPRWFTPYMRREGVEWTPGLAEKSA